MGRNTRKFRNGGNPNNIRILSGGSSSAPSPSPETYAEIDFNHPEQVIQWLKKGNNKNEFFFGLSSILRWKEEEMNGLLKSLKLEIEKISSEYKASEQNYQQILEADDKNDLTEMKEGMQEKVRENLNAAYQTKYSGLIQKKQAYEGVIINIQNRRWYIVNSLKTDNGASIINNIEKMINSIYNLYRGNKYKPIRYKLYKHLIQITKGYSSYQKTFILNTSITGPAGSGKTTLAREMGKWFSKLGLLTYDSFYRDVKDKLALMEVGRSDLIAEFTGQTAPKTLGVLARSLERTLFIDEAYSVAGCTFKDDDKLEPDPYGEEFVAELLRFMNDHKSFNALIVAGYENLMNKCFFARNEGLPRRFAEKISLPFYSTDELYGIFAKNVCKKRLADINSEIDYRENQKEALIKKKGDQKNITDMQNYIAALTAYKEQYLYSHFYYLAVTKPSFMMIHYDTSYDGIDTLRKYLTILQIRHGPDEIKNIYSMTILNHVFTNLLGNPIRKELFRRKFYEEVFHFEQPNLSYFPAQAGEMENLADAFAGKLAMDAKPGLPLPRPNISSSDETAIINDYCKNKKIEVKIGPIKGDERIAATSEDKTEKKLKADSEKLRILIDNFISKYEEDPTDYMDKDNSVKHISDGKPVTGIKFNTGANTTSLTHKGKDYKMIQDLKAKVQSERAGTPISEAPAQAGITSGQAGVTSAQAGEASGQGGGARQSAVVDFAYELCMIGTEIKDIRRKIYDFLDLDGLGILLDNNIPSLIQLWAILKDKDKRTTIISHVVHTYAKKIDYDYIDYILNESEKNFPIHLTKELLQTEKEKFRYKVDLDDNYKSRGTPKNDKAKSEEVWLTEVNKIVTDSKSIMEASPYAVSYSDEDNYMHSNKAKSSIVKNDILYEDFGISEKVEQ